MSQPTPTDRHFPAHRAFVIQLGWESDVAGGEFAGRVEHVVSGEATHFQAFDELLAFIGRVLAHSGSAPPEAPGNRLAP